MWKSWVKEQIKREIRKYLETHQKITYQNLQDAVKTVSRG